MKKPAIPEGTPQWLRTMLEILVGRRKNQIPVPALEALSFTTPTADEVEALYAYVNSVRNATVLIIDRLDEADVGSGASVTGSGGGGGGGGGSGSVTSVGLAKTNDDTISVSGSPVTTSGTLSLDAVDAGAADALVGWDDSAGKKIYFALGVGLSTSGTTLNSTGGTVTSVGLSMASDDTVSVSGSPVTGSGTLVATAVDAGADMLVMWDDSAGKKVYATIGTGLLVTGTTITGITTTPPAWARVAADGTELGSGRVLSTARTSEGVYTIALDFTADTVGGEIQLSAVATPSGTAGDGGDGVIVFKAFSSDEATANDSSSNGQQFWWAQGTGNTNGYIYVLGDGNDLVYEHDLDTFSTVNSINPSSDPVRAPQQSGAMDEDGTYLWLSGDGTPYPVRCIEIATGTVTDFGTTADMMVLAANASYVLVREAGGLKRYAPNIGLASMGSATSISATDVYNSNSGIGCWDANGNVWFAGSNAMYECDPAAGTLITHAYPTASSLGALATQEPACVPVFDTIRGVIYLTITENAGTLPSLWRYEGFSEGIADSGEWTELVPELKATALHHDPASDVLYAAEYGTTDYVHRYFAGTWQRLDSVWVSDESPANPQVDYDLQQMRRIYYRDGAGYVQGRSGSQTYLVKIIYAGAELDFGSGGSLISSVLTAMTTIVDDETVKVEIFRSLSPIIRADAEFSVIMCDADTGGTSGVVSSVALSMPAEFSVAGSPITSTGTLTVSKANQSANLVFAGPSSGGAAAPTFRALVAADVPTTPATSAANINGVMNGAFNVWQRGTFFSSASHNTVTADRWRYQKSGAMVHDISRSTDVPSLADAGRIFDYSILIDCTTVDSSLAASDYAALVHRIEGYEWAAFAQRALILSFWVKATKTGTYCVGLVNSGGNRSYVGEYTINVTDTWEYKTVTVSASPSAGTWDYVDGTGIALYFTLAAGSSLQTTAGSWQTTGAAAFASSSQVNACDNTANNFRLAAVQLQVGSTASEFEHVSFAFDLQRCLRYFEKSFQYTAAPATGAGTNGSSIGVQVVGASTAQAMAIAARWQVRKRSTSPTITLYNTAGAGAEVRDVSAGANCSSTSFSGTENDLGMRFACTTAGGSAAGNVLAIHWTCDAELS